MPVPTCEIHEVEECPSTQDLAHERLLTSASNFCAVRAERQSRGRGRQDHLWISPPGNLYLSVAFRVDRARVLPWPFASLLAGLAVARILDKQGYWQSDLFIKWPNDIFRRASDGFQKLGGILTELKKDALVIGVGLNILDAPPLEGSQYGTVSLASLAREHGLNFQPHVADIAAVLTQELREVIESWMQNPIRVAQEAQSELQRRWMKAFWGLEGFMEGQKRARALELLPDGRLSVQILSSQETAFTIVSSGEFRLDPECRPPATL